MITLFVFAQDARYRSWSDSSPVFFQRHSSWSLCFFYFTASSENYLAQHLPPGWFDERRWAMSSSMVLTTPLVSSTLPPTVLEITSTIGVARRRRRNASRITYLTLRNCAGLVVALCARPTSWTTQASGPTVCATSLSQHLRQCLNFLMRWDQSCCTSQFWRHHGNPW